MYFFMLAFVLLGTGTFLKISLKKYMEMSALLPYHNLSCEQNSSDHEVTVLLNLLKKTFV